MGTPPYTSLRQKNARRLALFRRREDGSALVEFAITLPLILILGLLSVECMRLFWSYQAAIAGVRDATRYLARIAPADICTSGGSVAGYATQLQGIVRDNLTGTGGTVFTGGVNITSVTPSVACITTLGLRQASVPVATVTANMTMTMPFSQILRIVGGTRAATLTTAITDRARVYGL